MLSGAGLQLQRSNSTEGMLFHPSHGPASGPTTTMAVSGGYSSSSSVSQFNRGFDMMHDPSPTISPSHQHSMMTSSSASSSSSSQRLTSVGYHQRSSGGYDDFPPLHNASYGSGGHPLTSAGQQQYPHQYHYEQQPQPQLQQPLQQQPYLQPGAFQYGGGVGMSHHVSSSNRLQPPQQYGSGLPRADSLGANSPDDYLS